MYVGIILAGMLGLGHGLALRPANGGLGLGSPGLGLSTQALTFLGKAKGRGQEATEPQRVASDTEPQPAEFPAPIFGLPANSLLQCFILLSLISGLLTVSAFGLVFMTGSIMSSNLWAFLDHLICHVIHR